MIRLISWGLSALCVATTALGEIPKTKEDWIKAQLLISALDGFYENYTSLNKARHVPHDLVVVYVTNKLVPGRLVMYEQRPGLFRNAFLVKARLSGIDICGIAPTVPFGDLAARAKKILATKATAEMDEVTFESAHVYIYKNGAETKETVLMPKRTAELDWFLKEVLYPPEGHQP